MKGLASVFKKEMRRFFTDKRMLGALFLPGVLIAILYTVLGRFLSSAVFNVGSVENYSYSIAYSDNSGVEKPSVLLSFDTYLTQQNKGNSVTYYTFPVAELEAQKELVKEGKYDVVIAFSDDFEIELSITRDNHIDLFYNGSSKAAYSAYSTLVELTKKSYDAYAVNTDKAGTPIPANLASTDYVGVRVAGIIFPMITVSLLFSTVVSICPDSIAGEKERGTMAAMLIAPVKRRDIAMGKAAALLVTSIASGLVSFIGIAISLPALLSSFTITIEWWAYILIGLLIVSTLGLFVAVGLLVSTLAKSTKETSTILGPLMVVFLALSVIAGLIDTSSIGFAFVPFLNVVSCMSLLIGGHVSVPYFLISIGISALATIGIVFIVSRLFDEERVMVK